MEGDIDFGSVKASERSFTAVNFIRQIVDRIVLPAADASKPLIPLSIGDPTLFGNLPPPGRLADELARLLSESRGCGYLNSMGAPEARAAVARSLHTSAHPVLAEDVCLASGCSHAISLALESICDKGSSVLIPAPGFSLYRTLAKFLEIEAKEYRLDAQKNWEVDLDHLESLITDKTSAILVNNPSNPCGTNYSREHLLAILAVAAKHHLPIISDEVYADMVFSGQKFFSMQELSKDVPIIVCGGIAKRYMVPGFRVGWLVLCDRHNQFRKGKVIDGVQRLSQTILGCCSLIQGVLPFLLEKTPESYNQHNCRVLEENAVTFCKALEGVPALTVVAPSAAMYCMVGVDLSQFSSFPSDVEFAQALLAQEQVFVLPGSCFSMPSYFRVVLCAPSETLKEAARRIAAFVAKNRK